MVATTNQLLPAWAAPLRHATVSSRGLTAHLRRTVCSGGLAPGTRMPTSRVLAHQLGISRSVVVAAYSDLVLEGLLRGQGRHGTFVAGPRATAATGASATVLQRRQVQAVAAVPPHLDWRLGQASALRLPAADWAAACRDAGRHPPPLGYGDPAGEPALREALVHWLARQRSLDVQPRQVIVTQGAAQGLQLLFEALLRPGDGVAVEAPGYPRVEQLLHESGAHPLRVPVDDEGLQVERAFDTARRPALLHVTPGHQYPLGVRLSGLRRQQLLAMARRHRTLVVENEYDHEFVHAGPNDAPLFASAPEQVVLVGTFAKSISPSMRLGYVVASESVAERLAALVARTQRQVSWPVQHAVRWLLDSGLLDRHLRRTRRHGKRLAERLLAVLQPHAGVVEPVGLAGGLHLLLRCPTAASSARLAAGLRRQGVALDPLEAFGAIPPWQGVLMAYGHMTAGQLDDAVHVLQGCLAGQPRPRPR